MNEQRRRRLIEAYRKENGLAPERSQALWRELQGRLAAGALPARDFDIPTPRVPGLGARAWGWLPKPWLGALLVVPAAYFGLQGLASEPRTASPPPPGRATDMLAPTSHPHAEPALGPEPAPELPSEVIVEPLPVESASPAEAAPRKDLAPRGRRPSTPPTTPAKAARAPATSEATDPIATVDREMSMLKEANLLLKQKRPRQALRVLDRLEAEVPHGALSGPRAFTRVLALCASGAEQAARALAQAYVAGHPSSPYASRLAEACR